ncbi:hypothetical protein ACA910_010659 [Epithemia clementina (nom. ined.)]
MDPGPLLVSRPATTNAAKASPFHDCKFSPQGLHVEISAPADAKSSPFTLNSFYLDSAGRVQVSLPLQLSFTSKEALQQALETQCIQPPPLSTSTGSSKSPTADSPAAAATITGMFLLSVEARVTMTFGTGEAISATVESVSIESTRVKEDEDNVLCLQIQAKLRVARQGEIVSSVAGVKVNLEVVAILTEKKSTSVLSAAGNAATSEKKSTTLSKLGQERQALAIGLRDLHLGRLQSKSTIANAQHVVTKTKLAPPILCRVSLDHALRVDVRSMKGPTLGETWIVLNIAHSNTHSSPVTITNVSLHPAFSKPLLQDESKSNESSTNEGDHVDMSQNVHWSFIKESSATKDADGRSKFPKTLEPNEAYSTVLYLTAEEDTMSRSFSSPISVTATVSENVHGSGHDSKATEIVTVVHGEWTSAKRPIAFSDTFGVDFTLPDPETVIVGNIFSLILSVYNLGAVRRDVKLTVLSNPKTSGSMEPTSTFGGDDPAITFQNPDITSLVLGGNDIEIGRKHEDQLLAVDDSCIVGTVNSLERVEVKLRFIPLRVGALSFPSFQLVASGAENDKAAEPASIYSCIHNLQVVAKL